MAGATALNRARPGRRSGSLLAPRLAAAFVLLAGWQALALSGLLFRDVVPPLGTVAGGLARVLADPVFYGDLAVTAGEMAVALLVGGVAGLAAGLALGSSPFLSDAYERWLNYLAPTPKIILFPVLILLFGVGSGSKMAMGAVSCFFPLAISVAAGVRGIDPILLRVGHSFRAGRLAMLTKIVLPALAATLVNGFRLGFGVALIGVLLAETKLSNQGIGFEIINAYTRFDMPRMYALLILTIVCAVLVNMAAARGAARLAGGRIG
jgi:NitT/TauT family transport system permease protein